MKPLSILSIAYRVALRLVPLITDLVAATKKDSPGGRKVTPEEIAAILLEHSPLEVILEEAGATA